MNETPEAIKATLSMEGGKVAIVSDSQIIYLVNTPGAKVIIWREMPSGRVILADSHTSDDGFWRSVEVLHMDKASIFHNADLYPQDLYEMHQSLKAERKGLQ
jgi:hypothetical protein